MWELRLWETKGLAPSYRQKDAERSEHRPPGSEMLAKNRWIGAEKTKIKLRNLTRDYSSSQKTQNSGMETKLNKVRLEPQENSLSTNELY